MLGGRPAVHDACVQQPVKSVAPPMFLCVSPNPAIDKRLRVESVAAGKVIRARSAQAFAGGKSAHVAMVLRTLGNTPRWAGLCGDKTGEELASRLSQLFIETHPSQTAGQTRTNLEIIDDRGSVTEILEPGEAPTDDEVVRFEETCSKLFREGKDQLWVIFSGSLPPGISSDFYARLILMAKSFACRTCLDAGGEPLGVALPAHPDFIKPNRDEASTHLKIQIDTLPSAADALRRLIKQGARAAALSLGAEGMLYCAGESEPVLYAPAAPMQVHSAVGCGDSAMAGFVHAFASNASTENAIELATACAAANCIADAPGAARLRDIQDILPSVRVQILSE